MSIRQGLLALLEEGPRYGYQLRAEFEARTGATWPLNVGQVYSTLARLERAGLVAPLDAAGGEADPQVYYRDHGRRPRRGGGLVPHARRAHGARPRRAGHQARARRHGARRRRRARHPGPARGHAARHARLHAPEGARRGRATSRGCSCSTRSSSPPRPRSAGSTTARRAWPGRPARAPPSPPRAGARRRRRRGGPAMSAQDGGPVLELREVDRVHGSGETAVHALRRRQPPGRGRRAAGRDGAVGLGQVDAAHARRRARLPDGGRGAGRGPAAVRALAAAARRAAPPLRRLRVPGLQPHPRPAPRPRTSPSRASSTAPRSARPARRPSPRWPRSASPSSPTASPTTCPAASSSAWRSRAPSWATGG